MFELDSFSTWLRARTTAAEIQEVWIFGSVVSLSGEPGDVDVLVLYQDGWTEAVPAFKRGLQAGFMSLFGIPLHMLCLSATERYEQSIEIFLIESLAKAVRVR